MYRTQQQNIVPKCTHCGQVGHGRVNCRNPGLMGRFHPAGNSNRCNNCAFTLDNRTGVLSQRFVGQQGQQAQRPPVQMPDYVVPQASRPIPPPLPPRKEYTTQVVRAVFTTAVVTDPVVVKRVTLDTVGIPRLQALANDYAETTFQSISVQVGHVKDAKGDIWVELAHSRVASRTVTEMIEIGNGHSFNPDAVHQPITENFESQGFRASRRLDAPVPYVRPVLFYSESSDKPVMIIVEFTVRVSGPLNLVRGTAAPGVSVAPVAVYGPVPAIQATGVYDFAPNPMLVQLCLQGRGTRWKLNTAHFEHSDGTNPLTYNGTAITFMSHPYVYGIVGAFLGEALKNDLNVLVPK